MISKHHNELADAFTPMKKLDIWNRLVTFLQLLLNQQPNDVCHQNQDKKQSDVNLSHAKELDQSDDEEMDTSVEKTNRAYQHVVVDGSRTADEDLVSIQNIVNFLDQKEGRSLDCVNLSVSSSNSKVQMPKQTLLSGSASNISPEIVLSSSAITSMYRTLVYEGNWESQSSKVILVQVQSVIATIVMSFDHEDFTKVIQGIVEDVVSIGYCKHSFVN